jgi:hypothetical protein
MHILKTLCSATALVALLGAPPAARADEFNKLTKLTFSGPVQVPGHTLVAGTYAFKLADSNNRHVVQIWDKEQRKLIATLLAIPDERLDPADKPIVMFKETAAGTPPAIQAWFYPGNTVGDEFVYPRNQAVRIAKAAHRSVLSMADNSASDSDMKNAQIGRVGENGRPVDETTTGTTGTGGSTAAPMRRARTLPQTASPLALYELISGLALAGAFGIRRFTR